EYGTSTGRPRRTGWFDAVVARTSVALSGAEAIAITKLDVLDDMEEIPVCVAYKLDGKTVDTLPALVEDVERLSPIYEWFRAWKPTTPSVTLFEVLPSAAKGYVRFLEEPSGAKAPFISPAPRREETIQCDSSFLSSLPSSSA